MLSTATSPIVASTRVYSDIDLRDGKFIHPTRKDIIPVMDDQAVKNAVRNLVLTNFYEAPFAPFRGSNVRGLLFELADQYTAASIRKEIERVINQYEPRVNAIRVTVTDNSDLNAYNITIEFNIISLNLDTSVNFYLERLR